MWDAESFGDLSELWAERRRRRAANAGPAGPSLRDRASSLASGASVISERTAKALREGGSNARDYISKLS